jgi:hypothetical protein
MVINQLALLGIDQFLHEKTVMQGEVSMTDAEAIVLDTDLLLEKLIRNVFDFIKLHVFDEDFVGLMECLKLGGLHCYYYK